MIDVKDLGSIKPIKGKSKKSDFFVLDTETWGLSAQPKSFALGVIYGENHIYKTESIDELKTELASEKYKGKKIFAHNLEYDLSVIYGNILVNLDRKAIFNGLLIKATHPKNNAIFCNSLAILQTSLDNIGKNYGLEKLETPEKFIKGKRTKIDEIDIDYCIRDCEIIHRALTDFFELIGESKITLASASFHYWRKNYLKKPLYFNRELSTQFFKSYYGGRVEAFKLGEINNAVKYDINSLYPFVMSDLLLPDTDKLKRVDNPNEKQLKYILNNHEGLIKCKVEHKETNIGYLPVKHNDKLVFPVGTFTGVWNFPEIRKGISDGVINILSVEYIIFSKFTIRNLFTNFVNDLYKLRQQNKGNFKSYMYKIILNSLYGKFAQKIDYEDEYYEQIPFDYIKELRENKRNFKIIIFNELREDCYIRIFDKAEQINRLSIPLISSYITSYARLELLNYLLKYQNNGLVYCDTDSIFLEKPIEDFKESTELGKLKLEDGIVTEIRGNKNYTYEEKGKTKDKIKGVGKGYKRENNVFQIPKLIKTKEAIRRNMSERTGELINTEKILSDAYDKRIKQKDGTTKPIKINE